MDVCLLSDPPSVASTSSTGSHIRLYRLSGGSSSNTSSSANAAGDADAVDDEGSKAAIAAAFAKARAANGAEASGSSKVWETNIPANAVKKEQLKKSSIAESGSLKKDVKGKGRASQVQQVEETFEQPSHLPESISWSPDGAYVCLLLWIQLLTHDALTISWRIQANYLHSVLPPQT
jgi:hypothetical protein